LASATDDSSHISFTFSAPPPTSAITSPDNSVPHFQTNAVTLQGTAQYATTVQAQIIDCGPDLQCNSGNDDLDWNGTLFISPNTVLSATLASGDYTNGLWSYTTTYFQTGAAWVSGQNYEVQLFAKDKSNLPNASTLQDFTFDTAAPTATIVIPSVTSVNLLTS